MSLDVQIGEVRREEADLRNDPVIRQIFKLPDKPLSDNEIEKFALAFERSFILTSEFRPIKDHYVRHRQDMLLGLLIAKEQIGAEFDGTMPGTGMIGMTPHRANFFGIGDDWDADGLGDPVPFAAGAPAPYIHSGTAKLGGTDNNDIKILRNFVPVITGHLLVHLDAPPRIEALEFTVGRRIMPVLHVKLHNLFSTFGVYDQDKPWILKNNDQYRERVFCAFSPTANEYPIPLGVSYLEENNLAILDIGALSATDLANKQIISTV